jgi:hypothetical protein
MVWIVVAIHVVLSLGLLLAAWKVWQLRLTLASVARSVDGYAESCQKGLSVAPPAILRAQQSAGQLKGKYTELLPQLQRLQMFLGIFGLVRSVGGVVRSKPKQSHRFSKRSDRNGKRRR